APPVRSAARRLARVGAARAADPIASRRRRQAAARAARLATPTLLLAASTALAVAVAGRPYPDAPPLARTGGFGEKTCYECHFDGDVNAPGGKLTLAGVPERYVAGESYRLTIEISRPELRGGGF